MNNSKPHFWILYIKRYIQYFVFVLRVFFYEKPRGLDFYARDLSLKKSSKGKYHGYSVSPQKV
jgi:hypothetical protein